MKDFKVFTHPQAASAAVKIGFSWPGLFFGVFWLLWHRMWGRAALWVAVYVASATLEHQGSAMAAGGVQVLLLVMAIAGYAALAMVPGLHANRWREARLQAQAYVLSGVVSAANAKAAIAQVAAQSRAS